MFLGPTGRVMTLLPCVQVTEVGRVGAVAVVVHALQQRDQRVSPLRLRHPRDDRQEGHREAQGGEGGQRLTAGERRPGWTAAGSSRPAVSSSSRASRIRLLRLGLPQVEFLAQDLRQLLRRGLPVAVLEDQRRGGVQDVGLLALGVEHGQPIAHRFGGQACDSLSESPFCYLRVYTKGAESPPSSPCLLDRLHGLVAGRREALFPMPQLF